MAYIKISDPNVIDLAAWQQVINVVNQHSDSITAITNNFGIQGTGETNWSGASDLSHEYDPGSQKIVYGKNKFDPTSSEITATVASNNVKHVYYGTVVFEDEVSGASSFDAPPIITATIQNTQSTEVPWNAHIVVTIVAVTNSGFIYRVTNPNSTSTVGIAITGTFFVNWMAIGPK
jgi:hypothetical protein